MGAVEEVESSIVIWRQESLLRRIISLVTVRGTATNMATAERVLGAAAVANNAALRVLCC
jgi:hypothetical protein